MAVVFAGRGDARGDDRRGEPVRGAVAGRGDDFEEGDALNLEREAELVDLGAQGRRQLPERRPGVEIVIDDKQLRHAAAGERDERPDVDDGRPRDGAVTIFGRGVAEARDAAAARQQRLHSRTDRGGYAARE